MRATSEKSSSNKPSLKVSLSLVTLRPTRAIRFDCAPISHNVAMYKTKPRFPCVMPSDAPLNVLALNASLKHEPLLSNTGELASLVLEQIRALAPINADMVRLSDAALPVGLGFREAGEDDWPGLVTKIKAADVVLFCTPIWWGGRSSLM